MEDKQAATQFSVKKASGAYVPFDEAKIRRSLHRSGVHDGLIERVMQEIRGRVYEGMPTKALFKMAYKTLKRLNRPLASRYSLKQAMLELGPSGYPFEHFFAEILKTKGYSTKTGVIMSGKCILHEVDVVAENSAEMIFTECKYHAQSGVVCDVKIPLYIHSRFRDLSETANVQKSLGGRNLRFFIATNTRFSDDAIRYGACAGLEMFAWDYPAGKGLRELIDGSGLHPITCIGALTRYEKLKLLEKGVVLCQHILDKPELLDKIGLTSVRQKIVLNEAKGICERY